MLNPKFGLVDSLCGLVGSLGGLIGSLGGLLGNFVGLPGNLGELDRGEDGGLDCGGEGQ